MSKRVTMTLPVIAVAGLAAGLGSGTAFAQGPTFSDETPRQLRGVGIEEHLDERIPLELTFTDERGDTWPLQRYFQEGKPVILTLNYYRCPMLCGATLNGMLQSLQEIDWSAGAEFEIVTVSINPDEKPDLAAVKKRAYLSQYTRETAKDGWHFLTGDQPEIEALAAATGFGYRYDEKSGEYAHSASIMFLTPDGRLSRYMNDVVFDPADVRLALVEASEGAIGSPLDKFLLFTCYQYDPAAGGYGPSAMKVMRLAGAVTVLGLLGGVIMLAVRGARTSDKLAADGMIS
ncbi:MAG: SCO family protein [Phycisphaerales bacterium]|nr:SCO family protein [Phycisphaerae bacterium]NNM27003.1 SCO family protein [Phycisphaerales bacterium]